MLEKYAEILIPYIANRTSRMKQVEGLTELKQIKLDVPQGSVLGLYLHFFIPLRKDAIVVANFADHTVMLALGEAIEKLKNAADNISKQMLMWRIKLNENKSFHNYFNNKINYN